MKTQNGDKATLREVYTLVEDTRKEVTSSINRLENKFDLLEAGRLTMLEKDLANLQGKLAIIAAIISFAISLFFVVLNKFI